jgi:hypothetical protein
MICGFLLHDISGLIFDQVIGLRNTLTFLFLGLFTLLSRLMEKAMKQESWPTLINVAVNAVMIWVLFKLGTVLNGWLLPGGRIQL